MKKFLFKQTCVSLLELMLSLAIIALIFGMTFRYFSVSSLNGKVSRALSQIHLLTEASYTWLKAQNQPNFSEDTQINDSQTISMQALIDADLIPSNNNITQDPWSGVIEVSPGSNPQYVKITLPHLPIKACNNLSTRLKTIAHSQISGCVEDGEYWGEF